MLIGISLKNLEVLKRRVELRCLLTRAVDPPQLLAVLQVLFSLSEEPEATQAHSLHRPLPLHTQCHLPSSAHAIW